MADHTGLGVHVSGSASIDNGAFAGDLGLRYAFDETAILGLDAEYDPWFSFEGARVLAGAFNAFATFFAVIRSVMWCLCGSRASLA